MPNVQPIIRFSQPTVSSPREGALREGNNLVKLLEKYQYLGDVDAIPEKNALNVDAEFERVITEARLNRESEMGQIDPVSRPFAVLSSEWMAIKEDQEDRMLRETVEQIIDEMEGK